MKRCTECGTAYQNGEFCPLDGARLHEIETPIWDSAEGPASALAPVAAPVVGGRVAATADLAEQMSGQLLAQRYRLGEQLGAGGMGIVYDAIQVVIEKAVAIKVLKAAHARVPDVAVRFSQEALLASRIDHPNVVKIFDYGTADNGCPYFVMELLPGHALAWEIDHRGPIDPRRAIAIAEQIAQGLAAAHQQGVVHRDLKPDNIFLLPPVEMEAKAEVVKILDFGIARVAGRRTRLTAEGAVVGTPEYMSPEQAQGGDVDGRADLYALGVILFEMLTGRVPFHADSLVGTLTMQVYDAAPLLSLAAAQLPPMPETELVIARLLEKLPSRRPSTGLETLNLLRAAAEADFRPVRGARRTIAIGSWAVGEYAGEGAAVGDVAIGAGTSGASPLGASGASGSPSSAAVWRPTGAAPGIEPVVARKPAAVGGALFAPIGPSSSAPLTQATAGQGPVSAASGAAPDAAGAVPPVGSREPARPEPGVRGAASFQAFQAPVVNPALRARFVPPAAMPPPGLASRAGPALVGRGQPMQFHSPPRSAGEEHSVRRAEPAPVAGAIPTAKPDTVPPRSAIASRPVVVPGAATAARPSAAEPALVDYAAARGAAGSGLRTRLDAEALARSAPVARMPATASPPSGATIHFGPGALIVIGLSASVFAALVTLSVVNLLGFRGARDGGLGTPKAQPDSSESDSGTTSAAQPSVEAKNTKAPRVVLDAPHARSTQPSAAPGGGSGPSGASVSGGTASSTAPAAGAADKRSGKPTDSGKSDTKSDDTKSEDAARSSKPRDQSGQPDVSLDDLQDPFAKP